MAKFKYKANIDSDIGLDGILTMQIKKNGTEAVWTDEDTGAKITVGGKNFVASDESEYMLGGGVIKSVVVTDGDSKIVVTVSDLNLKATKVMAGFEGENVAGLLYAITAGDDTVSGNKKDQYLVAGAGDDVMTGGKGSDFFEFHALVEMGDVLKTGPEHDIITDFDWKGEDADSLQYLGDYKLKSLNHGED